MSDQSKAWHQRMRDAGLCPRCSRPHQDVNPHTGRKFWRCAFCRAEQAGLQRKGYAPSEVRKQGQRIMATCECRRPMLPTATECFHCRYKANGWKGGSTKPKAIQPKAHAVPHLSQRPQVQHDPIAARLRWAQAVSR